MNAAEGISQDALLQPEEERTAALAPAPSGSIDFSVVSKFAYDQWNPAKPSPIGT